MPYEIGLGEAIAQGLAQGSNNFVGLQQQGFQNQNQLRQQNIQNLQQEQARAAQQKQQDLQNAQYEAQQKKGQNAAHFQFAKSIADGVTSSLRTGELKDPLDQAQAQNALKGANKMMTKLGRGQDLEPGELEDLQGLMDTLTGVAAKGAAAGGNEAAFNRSAVLGTQLANSPIGGALAAQGAASGFLDAGVATAVQDAAGRKAEGEKLDLTAKGQGVQKNAIDLQYLEPTYQAQLRQQGIVSDTGEFNLKAMQDLAPEQLEALRGSNAAQRQALATNKLADPLKIKQAEKSLDLLDLQIKEATRLNTVADDLQAYDTAGKRSDYLSRMAKSGDKSGLQRLADKGLLNPDELEQFGVQAQQAQRQGEAATVIQEGTAKGVGLDNTLKDGRIKLDGATYDYTVRTAAAGANSAETAASQASASLELFKAKAPSEVKIIEGQAALIAEELDATKKVNPLKLQALKEAVYEAARKNKVGDAFDEKDAEAAYQNVLAGIGLTKAQTKGVEVNTEATTFNTDRAKQLLPGELKAQGLDIEKGQAILDTMGQALNEAREGQPDRLGVVKAQRGQLEQFIAQNKAKFPKEMAALDAELKKVGLENDYLERTQDTRIQVVVDQGKITAAQATEAQQTLAKRITVFNSDADLKIKTNQAEGDLLELKEAGARGAYLKGLSDLGAPGQTILSGLVSKGIITPQQAGAFKAKAGQVEAGDAATLALKEAQGKIATLTATVKDKTFTAEVATIIGQKDNVLADLQLKLQNLKQNDAEFPQKQALLKAQIANVQAGTANTNQATAKGIALLPGEIVQQDAETANLNASTNRTNSLTPGEVTGQNLDNSIKSDNAFISAATKGDKVTMSKYDAADAKTRFDTNLLNLKFADATFMDKVKGVALGNAESSSRLKSMLQTYQQNAVKFPEEIKELKGRIAYNDAQTAGLLAAGVAKGTGGKNEVTKQLKQLRISTSDDRRYAEKNLSSLMLRFLPNAKFSIDKYDPKNFSTLTATATPEQAAQLNAAAAMLDGVKVKQNSIQSAFAKLAVGGTLTGKDLSAIDPSLVDFNVTASSIPAPSGKPTRGFNPTVGASIQSAAKELGINPNDLAAVISFETGGSFSPSQRTGLGKDGKPLSSATGLIQFMDQTAKDMGTTTAALAKMSVPDQMKYVVQYLKATGVTPGTDLAGLYKAIIAPYGKVDGLYTQGTEAYAKNHDLDLDGDGKITLDEAVTKITLGGHRANYFAAPLSAAPKVAPTPNITGTQGGVGSTILTDSQLGDLGKRLGNLTFAPPNTKGILSDSAFNSLRGNLAKATKGTPQFKQLDAATFEVAAGMGFRVPAVSGFYIGGPSRGIVNGALNQVAKIRDNAPKNLGTAALNEWAVKQAKGIEQGLYASIKSKGYKGSQDDLVNFFEGLLKDGVGQL